MASLDQSRIERAARGLGAYRKYAALRYEMAKYSMASQSKIESVARALYDAAPLEDDPERQEHEENPPIQKFSWDELDADAPIKEEFRVMAAIAVEAMTNDLDETLRQFQLPAVMSELTSLSKADALRVLNAAIEQIMEAK